MRRAAGIATCGRCAVFIHSCCRPGETSWALPGQRTRAVVWNGVAYLVAIAPRADALRVGSSWGRRAGGTPARAPGSRSPHHVGLHKQSHRRTHDESAHEQHVPSTCPQHSGSKNASGGHGQRCISR